MVGMEETRNCTLQYCASPLETLKGLRRNCSMLQLHEELHQCIGNIGKSFRRNCSMLQLHHWKHWKEFETGRQLRAGRRSLCSPLPAIPHQTKQYKMYHSVLGQVSRTAKDLIHLVHLVALLDTPPYSIILVRLSSLHTRLPHFPNVTEKQEHLNPADGETRKSDCKIGIHPREQPGGKRICN